MPEENSRDEDTQQEVVKPNLVKSGQALLLNNNARTPMRTSSLKNAVEQEETYANCEPCQDDEENMYQNLQETKPPPPRNISRLYNETQKTSTMRENAKESKRRNETEKPITGSKSETLPVGKPMIGPKPETFPSKKIAVVFPDRKPPQKSFLHNPPKINQCVPKEITS